MKCVIFWCTYACIHNHFCLRGLCIFICMFVWKNMCSYGLCLVSFVTHMTFVAQQMYSNILLCFCWFVSRWFANDANKCVQCVRHVSGGNKSLCIHVYSLVHGLNKQLQWMCLCEPSICGVQFLHLYANMQKRIPQKTPWNVPVNHSELTIQCVYIHCGYFTITVLWPKSTTKKKMYNCYLFIAMFIISMCWVIVLGAGWQL